MSFSTLCAVRHHARVRHVEADVKNGSLAVVASVVNQHPRLGHRERQRLLPEHQLLTQVLTVQHPAHHVSVATHLSSQAHTHYLCTDDHFSGEYGLAGSTSVNILRLFWNRILQNFLILTFLPTHRKTSLLPIGTFLTLICLLVPALSIL